MSYMLAVDVSNSGIAGHSSQAQLRGVQGANHPQLSLALVQQWLCTT